MCWPGLCSAQGSGASMLDVPMQRGFGVVHGQNQSGPADHQFVVAHGQLAVQLVRVGRRDGRAGAGVGSAGVGAHGDVAISQADVAVV